MNQFPPQPLHEDDQKSLLHDVEARLRLIESNIQDLAIFTIDTDGSIASWSAGARTLFGYETEEIRGKPARLLFPQEDRELGIPEQELDNAAKCDRTVDQRWHVRKNKSSFWADGVVTVLRSEDGVIHGYVKVVSDYTDRQKRLDELEYALIQLSQILESITDPFYTLDFDYCFTYVNHKAEELWNMKRSDLIGKTLWDVFPVVRDTEVAELIKTAMTERRDMHFERVSSIIFRWQDVHIYPSSTGLFVYFRDINKRKVAEEQLQIRADQDAFIVRINGIINETVDPRQIESWVVAELGAKLGADRCYFFSYDRHRDTLCINEDWRRSDLPSLAGEYDITESEILLDQLFKESSASAIPDVLDSTITPEIAISLDAHGLRSMLCVPLYRSGVLMSALIASMADGPRDWTDSEIALADAVATRLLSAVEAARVAELERTLARQLQAAVQPPLPDVVPGLQMSSFYQPAFVEAGVGGDFYDVFAAQDGAVYLVVGDLSGKGIAAAAQVSTVRNMLRFALYNSSSLAASVSDLNRTLAENRLVTGFSTLFVGRFDPEKLSLSYVNCGQEPSLVLHNSGQIEPMPPTGTLLGAFADSVFTESTVILSRGDVFMLFTDGLTEAGPSRVDLLGSSGVAEMMRTQRSVVGANDFMLQLISNVEEFARGGLSDDIALLVGKVL